MPQHQDLKLLRPLRTTKQNQQLEQTANDPVSEAQALKQQTSDTHRPTLPARTTPGTSSSRPAHGPAERRTSLWDPQVPAGDYAVQATDGTVLAAVERKSLENLAGTLSDGTLAFQMQRLAELPLAAVVVEARYSALYKLEHVNGSWLADQLARLEVPLPRGPPRLRRLAPLR